MNAVIFEQMGQWGCITLNRPEALHALNFSMICALQKQLDIWKKDDSIQAILLQAAPCKAFCAGGDIRSLYENRANIDENRQFFWHEYRLNHTIAHYNKPYVVFMDGITMGGGVGIALHGAFPIASEHFVFAMPETSIGFFPDIGASYLLSRCPEEGIGMYLGLTGDRWSAQDSLNVGLVKYFILKENWLKAWEALHPLNLSVDAEIKIKECLQNFTEPQCASTLDPFIQTAFSLPSLQEILQNLQASPHARAQAIWQNLQQKSPLSLRITWELLQKAKHLTLDSCLKMDFNVVNHFLEGHDFYEGVRALLVDKDKAPRWQPQAFSAITEAMVNHYFEPWSQTLQF